MRNKTYFLLLAIPILIFFVIQTTPAQQAGAPQIRHIPSELQKYVETTNYKDVRIKKIPISMQCWTFRRFTFFDTLAKLKDLGIKYVQAFPGQALGTEFPNAKFDHNMTDELQAKVKD